MQSVWSLPGLLVTLWALTCACRHWISSPSLKFLTFTGLECGAACSRPAQHQVRPAPLLSTLLAWETCQEACGGWGQGHQGTAETGLLGEWQPLSLGCYEGKRCPVLALGKQLPPAA